MDHRDVRAVILLPNILLFLDYGFGYPLQTLKLRISMVVNAFNIDFNVNNKFDDFLSIFLVCK